MSDVVYDRTKLVEVARDLMEAMEAWFPGRPGEGTPEHFVWAAGFLARCHALLSGLNTLVEHGEDDAVPALYRPLLETYLAGLYALLGGADAVAALRAGMDHDAHNLEVALGRATKEDRPKSAEKLTLSDYTGGTGLVNRVDALLAEADPGSKGWARKAYTNQYLTTSFHDAHGKLGSLSGYLVDEADGPSVLLRRNRPAVALHLLDMSISLVFSFAGVWASQAGKDTSTIGALYDRWQQMPRPEKSPTGDQ